MPDFVEALGVRNKIPFTFRFCQIVEVTDRRYSGTPTFADLAL